MGFLVGLRNALVPIRAKGTARVPDRIAWISRASDSHGGWRGTRQRRTRKCRQIIVQLWKP